MRAESIGKEDISACIRARVIKREYVKDMSTGRQPCGERDQTVWDKFVFNNRQMPIRLTMIVNIGHKVYT